MRRRHISTELTGDAELMTRARRGDRDAFSALYRRHQPAALAAARSFARGRDPDDLVQVAFASIWAALQRGAGPSEVFRAYMNVTLRRLAAKRGHEKRVEQMPEEVCTPPLLDGADRGLLWSAYESLPPRWQAVLWLTAVEGHAPRALAGKLEMTAHAVAALTCRARERLRQAYLQAHLQAAPRPQCEPHRSRLGAFVRKGLSTRDGSATELHLRRCDHCRSLVAELADLNRMLDTQGRGRHAQVQDPAQSVPEDVIAQPSADAPPRPVMGR